MYLTNIVIDNHCSNIPLLCNHVNWGNVIKNKVLKDSLFYRIYFKNTLCSMNGMYIVLKINQLKWVYHNNTLSCLYNPISNINLINHIVQLEQSILNCHNISNDNKTNSLLICDDIVNNRIKISNSIVPFTNKSVMMLKISGLWETNTHRGLVYKFIIVNTVEKTDLTNSNNDEQNKII